MIETLLERGHGQAVSDGNYPSNTMHLDPRSVHAFLFCFAPSFLGRSVIIQLFRGGANGGCVTGLLFVFRK